MYYETVGKVKGPTDGNRRKQVNYKQQKAKAIIFEPAKKVTTSKGAPLNVELYNQTRENY